MLPAQYEKLITESNQRHISAPTPSRFMLHLYDTAGELIVAYYYHDYPSLCDITDCGDVSKAGADYYPIITYNANSPVIG